MKESAYKKKKQEIINLREAHAKTHEEGLEIAYELGRMQQTARNLTAKGDKLAKKNLSRLDRIEMLESQTEKHENNQ